MSFRRGHACGQKTMFTCGVKTDICSDQLFTLFTFVIHPESAKQQNISI